MRISDWSSDVCSSDLRISNTQPASNTPDKAAPTSITAADAVTMPSLRMTFSTESMVGPIDCGAGGGATAPWPSSSSVRTNTADGGGCADGIACGTERQGARQGKDVYERVNIGG